jgi:hypothetical protein
MVLYGQPRAGNDLRQENLFEYVARHNGPLDDYHPQMLLQCLLWGMPSSITYFSFHVNPVLQKKWSWSRRSF